MLDTYINEPSKGSFRYRSVADAVLLYVMEADRIYSADPADRAIGGLSECELGISILAFDPIGVRLSIVPVYMFTDSTPTVASGREIFGMPKQSGEFHIPSWDHIGDQNETITVKTWLIRHPDDRAMVSLSEFISIGTTNAPGGLEPSWTSPTEIAKHLAAFVTAPDPTKRNTGAPPDCPPTLGTGHLRRERPEATPGHPLRLRPIDAQRELRGPHRAAAELDLHRTSFIVTKLMAGDASMIMLKQFRDIKYVDRACYQAIVEAWISLHDFKGGGPLSADDWTLTFDDIASEPIRREMGIPAAQLNPQAAFWAEFEFKLDTGSVLWEAGVDE